MHFDDEELEMLRDLLDQRVVVTGYQQARILVSIREKILGRDEDHTEEGSQ